jgi:exodeoxyribonuclease VII small subunit
MKRKGTVDPPNGEIAEGQTFESMMERLQDLVAKLEEGNLSLEDSIRCFEEGMDLVRRCGTVLNRAEERIEKLTRDAAGAPSTQPLDGDEEEPEEVETGGDELPF